MTKNLPTCTLDPATIREYTDQIRAGRRPIALGVTGEDAWCTYVVDGHHKPVAYCRLNTRPKVLTACRMSPPPLQRDTFSEWFPSSHPLAAHYAKVKREHDG